MKVIIFAFALALCLTYVAAAAVERCSIIPDTVEEYNKLQDFNELVKKFGKNALDFLKCMGGKFITHCGTKALSCMGHPDLIHCLGLIVCEGKDAKDCIEHLKKPQTF